MAIRKELIDELPAASEGPLIGPNGLSGELTKALVERMLGGELTHHLGYEKHDIAGYRSGDSRNGKSSRKLKGNAGSKNRGSFPSQEAALKLIYLALRNVSKKWEFVQGWREALPQFVIRWPERIEQARAV